MIQEYFNNCRTAEELQKEHRRLVIQMHPDRNPDAPDATAKFQEMQTQYEERLAELHGDYRAAAKGRARREQAEREEKARREREKREREKHRVEDVINQARRNKGVSFEALKEGDYIYARRIVDVEQDGLKWKCLSGEQIAEITYNTIPLEETVVKIEKVSEMDDFAIMKFSLSNYIHGVYGGFEVLQNSEHSCKGKRVANVVMFRSKHYVFFGNPKGDFFISDYYVPINYEEMLADWHLRYAAEQKLQEEERKRIEAERMAKLEAEQKPLIEEWTGKLVAISAALNDKEKETVAMDNLKKMLKVKFPGVTFRLKKKIDSYNLTWEDGPVIWDVCGFSDLFTPYVLTPWGKRFGHLDIDGHSRTMSTITKATILEQLGQIADVFATHDYTDDVEVGEVDWMLMHLLVGVNVEDKDADVCPFGINDDGKRIVRVEDAVSYVFSRTSYAQKKKANRRKQTANV